MTKFFLLVLCFFVAANTWAGDTARYSINELRLKYQKASLDEATAKEFNRQMSAYNGKDPLVKAYQAASEAVMAKYVWNPYSKLKHLQTASAMFQEAVKLDARQSEIRFLRFTVEHYVPRYLNLSGHIAEDKKRIIESLQEYPESGLSEGLARTMRDFMLSKDHCTAQEKKILRDVKI
ncbi:hypothetical protein I2I11_19030 [Pontibacter sp. 172403-2]|uniref:hypothetical protein n=1 Tax=Pontibacter rufus TaxID=2791028 RepID=UPI0018AFDA68|nr:hypothetical protein [Pontibacter sp. 172403-2]MBF9255399.1 hypothetical protein [Pontibacter sp. 172403-2]